MWHLCIVFNCVGLYVSGCLLFTFVSIWHSYVSYILIQFFGFPKKKTCNVHLLFKVIYIMSLII
jgi:hypothetical protein